MSSTFVQAGDPSRRHLLKTTAAVGGATAAAGLIAEALDQSGVAHAASMGGDVDILNYALTLEHLEDAMYQTLIGSGLFYGQSLMYARTFGAQEHAHVVALSSTITKLGGTPVQARMKYNFPRLKTLNAVVDLLVMVEDLGASAYLGAAPMIQDATLLDTAVAIHTVEAEHATAWRMMAGMNPVPFAFAPPSSMSKVEAAVKPFLG